MTKDVCVIVVSYNSAGVLPAFLKSIPAGTEVVVVDNASDDNSISVARASGATVLRLGTNIGYGAACNAGAKACDAEFLIFANPDLKFAEGAIEALAAAARRAPSAAFNPRIYSRWKRQFRRRSRLMPDADSWKGPAPETDTAVSVLSGACILVRREHFERIGGFDPEIFLFHEDDDLSLRLKQSGVDLRIAADASVQHLHGDSSGRSVAVGRRKGEAMAQSLVHVMRKHNLPFDLDAESAKAKWKLFWPHVFLSPARLQKNRSFLHGLRSAQRADPRP